MSKTAEAWANVMETHSGYPLQFGPTNVDRYVGDPKRFGFFMARYKFAGKMLAHCRAIVDVGCGDGMGTIGLLSETKANLILGIDFEEKSIGYAKRDLIYAIRCLRPQDESRLRFIKADFLQFDGWGEPDIDGLVCLDVIEHIEPAKADDFIDRLALAVDEYGAAVIGTPSLAGAAFASVHSQAGHINLYDPDRLRLALERKFRRVFLFSMNDEVVHTGFDKLAHYLMALCVK